ncbi:response regulator [Paenibacillus sp. ACRRX]|uniref:response regulator n=1 Tax=unclassified Paenibacillus TaxID=185978 RepID=UPI001EF707ED|nr:MULTISPECIES: response regulator [unclassified Paenibacillus]MCG7408200.1 response regulator [Paenibacillus sp. ACRRX]MDK8181415.1 response regulator [Paenibacillus sp. UMB4589-SE434]
MTYQIVVVDDELPALGEMEDLLKEEVLAGEVVLFSHAEHALEWVLRHEPDIVLLDIQMPGINGLAFAERLLDAKSMIEVVFVTAYNQYALQAFELSAVDYILKPVKPERLSRTLQRIHSRRLGQMRPDHHKLNPNVADAHITMDIENQQAKAIPSIFSLGRLKIEAPSGLLKWRTVKVEELFAYLLLKGSASLDQIINDIFPNSDPNKAKAYVHTCVYQIRRAVVEVSLQTYIHVTYTDRMYKLILSDIWHDRELFMNEKIESSDIKALEEMSSLYRGDWCEGLDGMWMTTHREEIRDRYLWLLEDMVDLNQKQGEYRKALASIRKLMKLDPWNEHYASLMTELYVENGEKTRAKHFVQEYQDQYERELGESLSEGWYQRIHTIFEDEVASTQE